MQNLILFLALILTVQLSAQTKLIAYKSHAGDLDFFIPDSQPDDDYGLPSPRIIKIEKINDSTIVETTDIYWDGNTVRDTVVNHPYFSNPNMSLEEIKAQYYRSDIIFEGFETKKQAEPKLNRKEKRALKRAKKQEEKKLDEENKTPPSLLKKGDNRIKPACEPKQDSSINQERAMLPLVDVNNPLPPAPPSAGSNWMLIVGLCSLYFLSLGYLVYRRQVLRSV